MSQTRNSRFCGQSNPHRVAAAIVIGALAVTPLVPNAYGQTRQSTANLRVLVSDLATQLRLAYGDNLPEYQQRYEQLRAAIIAWNASSHSAAERQEMATWLHESIRNSMPGQTFLPLPPAPRFAAAARVNSASQSLVVRNPVETAPASEGDPFRDDPAPASANNAD